MSEIKKILKNLKGEISKSDIEDLRSIVSELKDLHKEFSIKLLLRDDLVELKDRRYALSHKFDNEMGKFKLPLKEVAEKLDFLDKKIDEFNIFNAEVTELRTLFFDEDIEGQTLYNKIIEATDESKIDSVIQKTEQLIETHAEFFNEDIETGKIKFEELQSYETRLINIYNSFFIEDAEINENGEGFKRAELIESKYNDVIELHDKLFFDGEEQKSLKTETFTFFKDLEQFHKKIFGSENTKSLSLVLDDRLQRLKDIEDEARKVINLSSDAGLAGGFVEKGKQANSNKTISVGIFIIALIMLAVANFFTIDFSNLDTISPQSLLIRVMVNLPLIWIATVANINLNKYSRLEEEYAHKESLAKSYERYRDEVEKLVDEEDVGNLKSELIGLNLKALSKNPAETMKDNKSNLPYVVFDGILDKKSDVKD